MCLFALLNSLRRSRRLYSGAEEWYNTRKIHNINYNKSRLTNVENWSIGITLHFAPKFSPELWCFSPQVQKLYDYVTKRTRKSIKDQFQFSNRDTIVIYVSFCGQKSLSYDCLARSQYDMSEWSNISACDCCFNELAL